MTDVSDRTSDLPRWNRDAFFAGLDAPEFVAAAEGLRSDVAALGARFDADDIRPGGDGDQRAATPAAGATADAALGASNALLERLRLVSAFVALYTSVDATDDQAAALESELRAATAPLGPLFKRLDAWLASFDEEALTTASDAAAAHRWAVEQAKVAAQHQLPTEQEELVAELDLSAGSQWSRLHREITSRLTADVDHPRGGKDLPMASIRALAHDPDPELRKAAYEAELRTFATVEVPLAHAMNGVKGQAGTLNRRRGWSDDLEPVLFDNAIDRPILDAMQQAITDALPRCRRALRAKAKALGHADGKLPWSDIVAPLPGAQLPPLPWEEAKRLVEDSFNGYAPSMGALAKRAFDDQWIDAEPRAGKRDGAFCMGVRGGESRVMCNYSNALVGAITVAHELGHAFHNACLGERTMLQRQTPMALAETASTFCETIMLQTALAKASSDADRLAMLEEDAQRVIQIVVDIRSRFDFESEVFARRPQRALSPNELNDAMQRAQRNAYGDAIDPEGHKYMWAVKPHYYGRAFYNWPYTFGLLFGTGLYARFREDPAAHQAGYEDLLSRTGMAPAAALAAPFGIDLADTAFWSGAMDVIGARLDRYIELLAARAS